MSTRLLSLLLAAVLGLGQSASAQRPRTVFDPNDPQKTRLLIPAAEREELGLTPKTWEGVVHPDVYTTLQTLNDTVERLRNTNTVDAIDTLDRMQFQGTVYVQVQLKHNAQAQGNTKENHAELRKVQHQVLDSLTAAEFHVRQLFKQSPGFVGSVNQEGLDKLAKHPDVVGVCLDDFALPERPPVIYKDQLTHAIPGEFSEEAGLKSKRVEVNVYQALQQSDRVFVLLSLEPKGEPLPQLTHVPNEMHQRELERNTAIRRLQDRVLSSLTADDFWLWTRLGGLPGLGGYVNRDGLERLWQHSEVSGVGIEGRIRLDPRETQRGRKP